MNQLTEEYKPDLSEELVAEVRKIWLIDKEGAMHYYHYHPDHIAYGIPPTEAQTRAFVPLLCKGVSINKKSG